MLTEKELNHVKKFEYTKGYSNGYNSGFLIGLLFGIVYTYLLWLS